MNNRPAYDLHIHSCLSPCADNDMTPSAIAGMAKLNGLDVVALTDHNSTANLPAFFECCRYYGVLPIAGMELSTAEDIHMLMLFRRLEDAADFGRFVHGRLFPVKNREDIYGDELIVDSDDNVIGREELLLINATSITVEEAIKEAKERNALIIPAHIDRPSNGMAAILGGIPKEYGFNLIELNDRLNKEECVKNYSLEGSRFIYDSDAHHLWNINEAVNRLTLVKEAEGGEDELRALFFDSLTA